MNLQVNPQIQLISALYKSASLIYPETGFKRIKDKAKFFLRGIATPRLTREWLQITGSPHLQLAVQNFPRLLSKLQRPYLHRNLAVSQRLMALKAHFSFLKDKIAASNLAEIYSRNGLLLKAIHLDDASNFSLRLFYRDVFEKEGELTVALCDQTGEGIIFAASFTVIASDKNDPVLFIGGLQSFKAETTRELVVAITRGMHGLRPKGLLLFAVQQLVKIWGIKKIRAVSNDMSVFQDFRLKKKKVFADYDEFWIESGGTLDADGLFTLPAQFEPRPMADIKPNKRTLYKKRYAMLEEMAEKIAHSGLTQCRPA